MTTDKAAPPDDIKALFFHLWDAVLAVHCGYRLGGSVLAAAQAERERAREQMEGAGNPKFLPEWRAEWEQSRLYSQLSAQHSKPARIADWSLTYDELNEFVLWRDAMLKDHPDLPQRVRDYYERTGRLPMGDLREIENGR